MENSNTEIRMVATKEMRTTLDAEGMVLDAVPVIVNRLAVVDKDTQRVLRWL